jgi:hypothetical protein
MAETNPIEVQRALKGVQYPTDRDHLTEAARRNGADQELVEKISHMPERDYDGPDKVEKALFRDS